MENNTVLLKGRSGYLTDLRPCCDSLYEKKNGGKHVGNAENHPFVAFVAKALKHKKRRPVVDVVRQYAKKAKLTKKETFVEHLKPFLDFEEGGIKIFNCKKLSDYLPMVVAYKHLNSVIYLESVMQ